MQSNKITNNMPAVVSTGPGSIIRACQTILGAKVQMLCRRRAGGGGRRHRIEIAVEEVEVAEVGQSEAAEAELAATN